MNRFNLEDRLVNFAVSIIEIDKLMPNSRVGNHLGGQILQSGTSPALNYGEAQSGESRQDFIHKIKIALIELRETFVCLKIIKKSKIINSTEAIDPALIENNEFIGVLVKSAETAQKNMAKFNSDFKFLIANPCSIFLIF